MLIICAVALMVILAVNIFGELKAAERSEKRRKLLQDSIKSAPYDWNKDIPSIIPFEALAQQRALTVEKRSSEEIYFLDACANFGESPLKREDKIILFSDIKNA